MWPSLETTPKTITVARNFVYITMGMSLLFSGASLISLIEHCVTFRHDKKLSSFLGFVHNWPTSRWSATKKETQFSFNGNRIMSFFLE